MKAKQKEIEVLRVMAETDKDDNAKYAIGELRKINPTFHYCPEWDGMVICDTDPEYSVCLCNYGGRFHRGLKT